MLNLFQHPLVCRGLRVKPAMTTLSIALALTLLSSSVAFAQNAPLLPTPHQIIEMDGVFNMNEFVPVFMRRNAPLEEQKAVWMLCESFENIFGKPLKITDKEKGKVIVLRNLSLETPPKKQEKMILPVGDEGYQLNVRPDKIEIIANSNTGLFYGSQTLLQLIRTSSLTGAINCMTINDMPSSSQRYLSYPCDATHAPSFNYVKYLIQCAAHFKFNGIAFFNDSLSAPFAEMELFYLKKIAEAYHIDIVTFGKDSSLRYAPFGMTECALREKAKTTAAPIEPQLFSPLPPANYRHSELQGTKQEESQVLLIDLKHKIYPPFQPTLKAVFAALSEKENKIPVFENNAAALFIDNWYSIFWSAELLWNQPKNNTLSMMKQRQTQYEKALDKQFFEVDFSLCEQLKTFDSLQVISLTEQIFWRSVTPDSAVLTHSPAYNRFVLERALAMEEKLQLLFESAEIANYHILYSMLFAAQRAEFIALKNLLQESLDKQSTENQTIKETVSLLLENIRHLKNAHAELWTIENDGDFPPDITQQYEQMILELETIE